MFVEKKYIGGTEEIKRLYEDGGLENILEGCERAMDEGVGGDRGGSCESCGDVRFVPCERCSGSYKIYYEEKGEREEEDEEEEGGFNTITFLGVSSTHVRESLNNEFII